MDSYKIGVSIVLANGMSPVLAIIGRDLLGLKTSISAIEGNFHGWTAAIGAAGLALGGAGLLGIMVKVAKEAADFQDAMTKISQLNPKVAALVQSGEIKRMSFSTAQNLGMNVEDVAKVYGGIYGVLQDPEEAEALTPIAARYARLMQLRHPGSHPEDSINTVMRAGELSGRLTNDKGAIDPEKVTAWFDMAARLEAATHGQVNAGTLLGLAQQGGGGAMRGLTQEGFEHMAILSQMMGGQRAGTALLSLRNQMSGAMLKRSAEAMLDYGMLKPGEATSEGGHVSLSEDATKRLLGTLNRDPVAFVDMMVAQLEKKGITSKEDQLLAISRMIGRQTSQREVSDILLSRQQMQRETEGLEQGVTVNQGLSGYDKNIHAGMQAMGAAWHNLVVAIGGPEAERFAAILNKITGGLNYLTDMVNRLSPEQVDQLFNVLVGIGAGMIVLAGIFTGALVTTLLSVPVAIGAAVLAIAAAFGTLIALNWSAVVGVFTSITAAIAAFIDQIEALYNHVKGLATGAPHDLGVDPGGSYTSPGKTGKPAKPIMFMPDTPGSKNMQAAFSLEVDGHLLAQSMIDNLGSLYDHATGAPSSDGVSSPFGGDHQYGSV